VATGGGAIVYTYQSDNTCNDSRTAADPDYHQVWTSTWDSGSGAYSSSASVDCLDKSGNALAMSYDASIGWIDGNGQSVSGPYELCAVSGITYY